MAQLAKKDKLRQLKQAHSYDGVIGMPVYFPDVEDENEELVDGVYSCGNLPKLLSPGSFIICTEACISKIMNYVICIFWLYIVWFKI